MFHLLCCICTPVDGGILSPFLFKMQVVVLISDTLVNNLICADDLVIFSLDSVGLQQLLKVCSYDGHDIDKN